MQNCLGMYVENNLIKYAKVSKDKEGFKVETFGVRFFDNLGDTIKKVIEETYSFNVPICLNLSNEKYLYYDIFSLLKKADIKKSVQTEFQSFCDEYKYNEKAFETKYMLVPNLEDKEKVKAIQVFVNKIDLDRQKKIIHGHNIVGVVPVGTSIASIGKFDKKENVLIVNMEEKTTITNVRDRQIYNVEILDLGSQEVLEKINKTENSMSKAYEICKSTTIYTADVVGGDKEQPYLQSIIPTLYQIGQKVKEIISESSEKITTVYLTGTLSVVNNVDLYFQEFMTDVECKLLKPNIIEGNVTQINIKDYIEVNSAISLAMQSLKEKRNPLNFKMPSALDRLKQSLNSESESNDKTNKKGKLAIDFSMKGPLKKVEVNLIRTGVAIILITIIYIVFSKSLYSQMENKQSEIKGMIATQQSEIDKITTNVSSLNTKNTKYIEKTTRIKNINDKISNVAEMKNSIPNLLNQIMYIIPENIQLTSIENTTGKTIKIVAQSSDYDQLGYFIAKIKLEGILRNVVSSSGQKSQELVTVTIEGELP